MDGAAKRQVLLVGQTLLAVRYLPAICNLLRNDSRIKVSMTLLPEPLSLGAQQAIEQLGVTVTSPGVASQREWDTAIFAAHGAVQLVPDARVKVRLRHSVADGKLVNGAPYGYGPAHVLDGEKPVYDVQLESSTATAKRVAHAMPQLGPTLQVVGDMWLDHIFAMRPYRDHFRAAMGIGPHQKAILLTSTWGPNGVMEKYGDIIIRKALELPDDYVLLINAHPHIWIDTRQKLSPLG